MAVATSGQVQTSNGSGATWFSQNTSSQLWTSVACDSNCLTIVATPGAQPLGYLVISRDSGLTWTSETGNVNSSYASVACDRNCSHILASASDYLYISSNGGVNWMVAL